MRRRLMLKSNAGVSPALPAEYQRVEWIGNATIAYITLPNMNFTQNSVVKFRFRKSSSASREEALFLAETGRYTVVEIGFLNNNRIFAYSKGGTSSTIADPSIYGSWVDYTVVYQSIAPTKKATAIVNGTTIIGTDGSGENLTGSARCSLFRNPATSLLNCIADLASFTLFLEGVLSLNLIPCYRKTDGRIGMYDTVSQSFLAGAGTFTKGADVN